MLRSRTPNLKGDPQLRRKRCSLHITTITTAVMDQHIVRRENNRIPGRCNSDLFVTNKEDRCKQPVTPGGVTSITIAILFYAHQ